MTWDSFKVSTNPIFFSRQDKPVYHADKNDPKIVAFGKKWRFENLLPSDRMGRKDIKLGHQCEASGAIALCKNVRSLVTKYPARSLKGLFG